MMDLSHYTFVQIHRIRVNLKIKLWVLGDYDVSVQLHPWEKTKEVVPLWSVMLIREEAIPVWGQKYTGNLCIFLSILL